MKRQGRPSYKGGPTSVYRRVPRGVGPVDKSVTKRELMRVQIERVLETDDPPSYSDRLPELRRDFCRPGCLSTHKWGVNREVTVSTVVLV